MNKYCVLLPRGHQLSESDIETLRDLIPEKSVYILDPALDGLVDFDDISHAQTVARTINEKSASVIDRVYSLVRSGKSLSGGSVLEMDRVIENTVKYVVENPVTMALIEQTKSWENYLQEHSSNVFYLSLVIGNKIHSYIKTSASASAPPNLSPTPPI